MNVRRMLAGLVAGAAVAGGTAVAATPESGTVSASSPKVEWTGEVTMSYVNRLPVLLTEDESMPCLTPSCDSFTLEVADQANLTLAVTGPDTASGDPASVTMRIFEPDGSVTVSTGDGTPDKPHKHTIKNAATGSYTIEYFNNLVGSPSQYVGSAELAVAGAEPVAPPGGGGEPTTPPPSGSEGFTVDVKPGKASARKLKRSKKLKAKVTVSREVQSVTGTLRKGKKTVGTGKLGSFSGTKTLVLKLKGKIKKGSYRLAVEATDAEGTRVGRIVTVKVKR